MKHSHRLSLSLIAAAVSAVLSATTFAQGASPSGSAGSGTGGAASESPGTGAGSTRRSQTGDTSRGALSAASFVKQASEDGMAEVELGKLAQKKAASDEVRSFGQMMVRDHEQANAELKSVASGKKLTVATEPGSEQRKMIEQLNGKSGKDFDTAYVNHMAEDHAKAVALFQQAAQSSDPDIARFASKTLPTLQNHKQMADTLRTKHGSKSGSMSHSERGTDAGASGAGGAGSGSGTGGTGSGTGTSGSGSYGTGGTGSGTGGTSAGGGR